MFIIFCKIKSFEIITLHTAGMRHVTDREIVMKDGMAEISEYAIGYSEGEEVRHLKRRAVCSPEKVLKLLNRCGVLSWDGFHGKRPNGIKDGTNFILTAKVNGGKKIHASGSQRFPLRYDAFKGGIDDMLKAGDSSIG